MLFRYATKTQRFVTFLIDYVLLSIIASYLGLLFARIFSYDTSATQSYYQLLLQEASNIMSGTGSEESLMFYFRQYLVHSLIDRCFDLSGFLLLVVGLLIILPKFWKGFTLGRKATHLVLVNNKGEKATIKNYLLRELLGTFLLYAAFGGILMFISLIIILVKNRSLVDLVSGTHLVQDPEYFTSRDEYYRPEEDINQKFDEQNDNLIKPDYHDVEENNQEAKEESNNEDDYKII